MTAVMTARGLRLNGGIPFQAHREKDRTPYELTLGVKHLDILNHLASFPTQGRTDAELTFGLRMHMAAARRCELRDMGAVRRGGRVKGAWAWKLTKRGEELRVRLNEEVRSA